MHTKHPHSHINTPGFPPPPDKCVFACVCACVHVYVREHKQALQAKFIAAPRYQGSKDGYVFKNAVRGLYVYVCMCLFPYLFSAVFSTLFVMYSGYI
jgi:hypothetical protein